MEIKLKDRRNNFKKETVLVFPFFSKQKIASGSREIEQEIKSIQKEINVLIEGEERFIVVGDRRFIFLNIGEKKKWNQRKFFLNLRKIIILVKENRVEHAAIFLEEVIPEKSDLRNLIGRVSENILLADYDFNRYKKTPKKGWPKIKFVDVIWPNFKKYQKDFEKAKIIGEAVNYARDLANIPASDITPDGFAKEALKSARMLKNIKTEIFGEEKLKSLGMGGILGVAKGSEEKPRFIILKYFGRKQDKKFDMSFVGKGVTFDSGGINLKPSSALIEMHMDMAGGAAVLGAILAIANLKTPLNIVALIPVVENMLSGHSFRPGDILKSYSGKTIEVENTDAEGRIVLADAISYSVKNFKPKIIVDVATLTGACAVALGQRATGLFTNMPEKENDLKKIGEDSGDYVWPLPCGEEYDEEIKGNIGDLKNMGHSIFGGAITAAVFLKNFVDNTSWVHLDIAPTMTSIEGQGLKKGATGAGVRYLVELAKEFKKIV